MIDVSKTFPARVWDGGDKTQREKDIIVAFSDGTCIDKNWDNWSHYELIKEPTFRKFRDLDEFVQWMRDTGRTDTRYIDFKGAFCGSINVTPATNFELLLMCKWFDNGEPIGIKE